jgi:hypothetical protein
MFKCKYLSSTLVAGGVCCWTLLELSSHADLPAFLFNIHDSCQRALGVVAIHLSNFFAVDFLCHIFGRIFDRCKIVAAQV